MRKIVFRGQDTTTGEWVYGGVELQDERYAAIYDNRLPYDNQVNVRAWTVGESTGLIDKNNKLIFEGDIFRTFAGDASVIAVVEWEKEGRFLGFTVERERKIVYINRVPTVEIIGNIYENPELIKI